MFAPPAGFEPHSRKSGLTAPWEPIFAARTTEDFRLGIVAGPAHTNSRGFVHGGLIAALADNAMGLSCATRADEAGSLVTVGLSMEFIGTGQLGEWIEIRATPLRVGPTLCFAEAHVFAADRLCARASATFRRVGGSAAAGRPA